MGRAEGARTSTPPRPSQSSAWPTPRSAAQCSATSPPDGRPSSTRSPEPCCVPRPVTTWLCPTIERLVVDDRPARGRAGAGRQPPERRRSSAWALAETGGGRQGAAGGADARAHTVFISISVGAPASGDARRHPLPGNSLDDLGLGLSFAPARRARRRTARGRAGRRRRRTRPRATSRAGSARPPRAPGARCRGAPGRCREAVVRGVLTVVRGHRLGERSRFLAILPALAIARRS